VAVVYAGQKIEEAETDALFAAPLHPYTCGLLAASPRFAAEPGERLPLAEISGTVPPATAFPPACRFAPRCAIAMDRCRAERPPLREHRPGHWAACWRAGEMPAMHHA
jgi:peptide/nickel transport system ATP-binding protein